MRGKVLALAALLAGLAGQAAANETFKDWWVTCDNTRDCAAFGFSELSDEVMGYLKVTRAAAADAQPAVKIAIYADDGAWSLSVD